MKAYYEVMEIRGVKVLVHWSVFALSALALVWAIQRPREILVGLLCYFGVILFHECGHMVIAQWKRCHVQWIKLYPILGLVSHDEPYYRFDDALIAWGGVLAQAMITVPVLLYLAIFGYTRYPSVNVALGIWGSFSLSLIVFNLIPFPPLDGSRAWYIVPELWKRLKQKSPGKGPGKNPYRFRGY
jgi:Zn-dependent protease